MVDKLLFLGGSSASGKTTAAAHLSEALKLHCVHLDEFYIPFHHAIEAKAFERDAAIDLTRSISMSIVESFLNQSATCIIEGGWLQVSQASTFTENVRFVAIFCGYPEADPHERWQQIKTSPGQHWLKDYDDSVAIPWLKQQIAESQIYRTECQEHNLPFVDCSDLGNATKDIVAMAHQLLR